MKTFLDHSLELVPHKEFDPKAFVGDESIPQELCNFILALALAYNDYKYYVMNYGMLRECKPEGEPQRTAIWGEHVGIKLHITRLQIGFVHELLKLIQKNKNILSHPFFREVVRVLDKRARDSWEILVEAALTEESKPRRSNLLFMIRNKITFHYEMQELFSGYRKRFFKEEEILENACISEGKALVNSRFYFADLAVQGYLEKEIGPDIEGFYSSLDKIMSETNMALCNICIRFIQRRGFPWKST